jgi:hypothetical protein
MGMSDPQLLPEIVTIGGEGSLNVLNKLNMSGNMRL